MQVYKLKPKLRCVVHNLGQPMKVLTFYQPWCHFAVKATLVFNKIYRIRSRPKESTESE